MIEGRAILPIAGLILGISGDVTGGNPNSPVKLNAPLTAGGDVIEYRVSPDASKAVYRGDVSADEVFELFSVPAGGGTACGYMPPSKCGRRDGFKSLRTAAGVYRADEDQTSVSTFIRARSLWVRFRRFGSQGIETDFVSRGQCFVVYLHAIRAADLHPIRVPIDGGASRDPRLQRHGFQLPPLLRPIVNGWRDPYAARLEDGALERRSLPPRDPSLGDSPQRRVVVSTINSARRVFFPTGTRLWGPTRSPGISCCCEPLQPHRRRLWGRWVTRCRFRRLARPLQYRALGRVVGSVPACDPGIDGSYP